MSDGLGREVERLKARVAELEKAREQWDARERELRASENFFSGILQIAEDAIISVDSEQNIRVFNQGAEKIFGFAAREVTGKPLDILLPDNLRKIHRKHVAAFGHAPEIARRMGERREIVGRRSDGTIFPAEASISKLKGEDGRTAYTVILRDISENKRQEDDLRNSREELRRLAAHLASVREEEGKRIAREVHDELGQWLTVIKIRLAALKNDLEGQRHEAGVEELIDLVSKTMTTVRRIATELRPNILDVGGLEAAIEWQLEEFHKHTGINYELAPSSVEHPPRGPDGNRFVSNLAGSFDKCCPSFGRYSGEGRADRFRRGREAGSL